MFDTTINIYGPKFKDLKVSGNIPVEIISIFYKGKDESDHVTHRLTTNNTVIIEDNSTGELKDITFKTFLSFLCDEKFFTIPLKFNIKESVEKLEISYLNYISEEVTVRSILNEMLSVDQEDIPVFEIGGVLVRSVYQTKEGICLSEYESDEEKMLTLEDNKLVVEHQSERILLSTLNDTLLDDIGTLALYESPYFLRDEHRMNSFIFIDEKSAHLAYFKEIIDYETSRIARIRAEKDYQLAAAKLVNTLSNINYQKGS